MNIYRIPLLIIGLMTCLCIGEVVTDDPAQELPKEQNAIGANTAAELIDEQSVKKEEVTEKPQADDVKDQKRQGEQVVNEVASEAGEAEDAATQKSDDSVVPQVLSPRQVLENRVRQLSEPPKEKVKSTEVQSQLDRFITSNVAIVKIVEKPAEKLKTMSLLMQGLYVRITRFPDAKDVDQLKSQLRSTARRTKIIKHNDARPIGDFWLMTIELYEINKTELPIVDRQSQAAELLADYLKKHPKAPTTDGVKQALIQLNTARGVAIPDDETGEAEADGDAKEVEDREPDLKQPETELEQSQETKPERKEDESL